MDVPEDANAAIDPEPSDDHHYPELSSDDPPRPFSYWVRRFLVCNPFYLVSAALLLYGFYLVSIDAHFPGREIAQLAFNFTALQCYEILLVATAILLARRRIWYDSNLLIFLENGLVLVPFILVSQAALIGQGVVRAMCVVGGAMALARFATLKRSHNLFNLPGRMLAVGLVLLAVNVALPLIYRTLNETKLGTKPTDGAAYHLNEWSWLAILPAIIALANVLPRPNHVGELLPQRRWIPAGLFALWLAGSTVHLCCLGYVYNFDWETPFLVPPLWVLAWTVWNRFPDFFRLRGLRVGLLTAPAVVTLVAALNSAPKMFLVFTGFNILIFAALLLKNPSSRSLRHLTVLSVVALGLGFLGWHPVRMPWNLNILQCVWIAIVVYACNWICLSRNPNFGIVGGVLVWIATDSLSLNNSMGPNSAIQAGLLFLLLHSLLWKDEAHQGAKVVRTLGCCLWLLHSIVLASIGIPHGAAILSASATLLLIPCVVFRLIRGSWPPVILMSTAAIVLLSSQGSQVSGPAQSVPVGLWVVAGSFMLFAIGTILALTRSRWHPPRATAATEKEPTR